MDERMAMLRSWVSGDYSVSELAAEYGVSRKTTCKWIERYEAGGWRALEDQSRAPRHHPNAVWCADCQGWFRTGDGTKRTPLTISDGHSRYLLRCQSLDGSTGFTTVAPLFIATFRQYGMPPAIRADNGTPFASTGLGGLSALSVWWVRLGLEVERIEPGQPQQNGRHERMHRALKAATAHPPQADLRQQQKAFDEFRREYNQERPHEALGQRPPAEVCQPAQRDYPSRLPEQRGYPDGWQKRRVQSTGQIKWKGQDLSISKALAGQEIGLEPVGEGAWNIHFEHLVPGHDDERKRQLKPRPRLSPKDTLCPT